VQAIFDGRDSGILHGHRAGIFIDVPISSGELCNCGGYVVRKWKPERQQNRQEQANHGEQKQRQHIAIPQTFGTQRP
jgi:hypothetical protein